MRRMPVCALCLALLGTMYAGVGTGEPIEVSTVPRTLDGTVKVYAERTEHSEVVGEYYAGETFQAFPEESTWAWLRVRTNPSMGDDSPTGHVKGTEISSASTPVSRDGLEPPNPVYTPIAILYKEGGGEVPCYRYPNADEDAFGAYLPGTMVKVRGKCGDYYEIFAAVPGFVHKDHLLFTGESADFTHAYLPHLLTGYAETWFTRETAETISMYSFPETAFPPEDRSIMDLFPMNPLGLYRQLGDMAQIDLAGMMGFIETQSLKVFLPEDLFSGTLYAAGEGAYFASDVPPYGRDVIPSGLYGFEGDGAVEVWPQGVEEPVLHTIEDMVIYTLFIPPGARVIVHGEGRLMSRAEGVVTGIGTPSVIRGSGRILVCTDIQRGPHFAKKPLEGHSKGTYSRSSLLADCGYIRPYMTYPLEVREEAYFSVAPGTFMEFENLEIWVHDRVTE